MSASKAKKPKYSFHKQKNYFKPNKRQFLEVGQRGFLATCNLREKDCVREAYNVLNHYADELYGPVESPTLPSANDIVKAEEFDIADDLQKEIDATNVSKKHGKSAVKLRFQVVDTGSTNCVFIRTTLPNPVELGTRVVSEISRTREQKSRFLLRLVPVEVVCRANLIDIARAGGELFDKYFLKEGTTFAIVFNKRYNNDVKRDNVIQELAALVQSKNIKNRVDLKQPEKTVLVEVIKGLCCLSVLDGYSLYKKYNLVELARAKEIKSVETDGKKNDIEIDGTMQTTGTTEEPIRDPKCENDQQKKNVGMTQNTGCDEQSDDI